jgi:hypothetical protein
MYFLHARGLSSDVSWGLEKQYPGLFVGDHHPNEGRLGRGTLIAQF